jgi:H+-transporting ATPase
MLNAFVGWYQEKQAGDIVEQLKAGIAMEATVRSHTLGITLLLFGRFPVYQVVRGGKEQEIAAREVVPGDIAIIEEGRTIHADGKACA